MSGDAAAAKVQMTLAAIATNVRTEIGKWEDKSMGAATALDRLQEVLERSAAVRAAGITVAAPRTPHGQHIGLHPQPHEQVQGGWGRLAALPALPLALALVLTKEAERYAKVVAAELAALVVVEAAICALCWKARKGYGRHSAAIGLNAAAEASATSISVVEFLEGFREIERVYGDQLDQKLELADPSQLGSVANVAAAVAQWDAVVDPRAAELRHLLFMMCSA
jgi:hypothetical protein